MTIARALANDPEILLLDEPTGDLDTKNTIEIMDLLLDINKFVIIIVLVIVLVIVIVIVVAVVILLLLLFFCFNFQTNRKEQTTCVMVTHNPDIECYADRLLYISDGRIVSQALNCVQSKLIYEEYIQYLNAQEG